MFADAKAHCLGFCRKSEISGHIFNLLCPHKPVRVLKSFHVDSGSCPMTLFCIQDHPDREL